MKNLQYSCGKIIENKTDFFIIKKTSGIYLSYTASYTFQNVKSNVNWGMKLFHSFLFKQTL